jgi:hypothetical protein
VQATIRLNDNLSIFPGVHMMYYDLDKEFALEPRLGLNWQFSASQKLSLGYGRHSRTQSLSTYFLGTYLDDGSLIETNTELGMTHSDQLVLGYDLAINEHTRLKAETYYQSLFDVPVEMRSSSFSMLNTGAGWGVGATDSLQNTGTGRNYGLEFTLERFFNKNFYYLTTVSLFESKYKGSDGVERNTVFNGNYVVNALFGREFKINDKSTFNIDLKATYAGGKRYTPILLADSQLEGKAVYDESKAYSEQFDPFFKTDIKFTYRLNMKKISQEWVFYIENVTNHENVLMQSYSRSKGEVTNVNQLGFFPMVQYRLHF